MYPQIQAESGPTGVSHARTHRRIEVVRSTGSFDSENPLDGGAEEEKWDERVEARRRNVGEDESSPLLHLRR